MNSFSLIRLETDEDGGEIICGFFGLGDQALKNFIQTLFQFEV